MPMPSASRPIQRVPSGFPGPGGTGFAPAAHGESGGYHHGFSHFTSMWKCPSGVGYDDCPVATPKTRQGFIPLYRYRWFVPRRITMTGPKLLRVTDGWVTFWTSLNDRTRSIVLPGRDFVSQGLLLRRLSTESTAAWSNRFASLAM